MSYLSLTSFHVWLGYFQFRHLYKNVTRSMNNVNFCYRSYIRYIKYTYWEQQKFSFTLACKSNTKQSLVLHKDVLTLIITLNTWKTYILHLIRTIHYTSKSWIFIRLLLLCKYYKGINLRNTLMNENTRSKNLENLIYEIQIILSC